MAYLPMAWIEGPDAMAAYFADEIGGAQTLVCSEIGSEGRNFQFAHHLILFDLPLNPDLLEQRIGRLDRIGQQEDVQIHVPHLQGTARLAGQFLYHPATLSPQIRNLLIQPGLPGAGGKNHTVVSSGNASPQPQQHFEVGAESAGGPGPTEKPADIINIIEG